MNKKNILLGVTGGIAAYKSCYIASGLTKLGYNVGRISNYIYHLEHSRGENSWFSNPHMNSNMSEWDKIQKMTKEELIEYYSVQSYLKKYQ